MNNICISTFLHFKNKMVHLNASFSLRIFVFLNPPTVYLLKFDFKETNDQVCAKDGGKGEKPSFAIKYYICILYLLVQFSFFYKHTYHFELYPRDTKDYKAVLEKKCTTW